jgi:hypothetical protein
MPFKEGESGNPNGRPKQIATSDQLRKMLAGDMPEIITKLVSMAKDGDATAIKIILDRTHPPLKAQALPVVIPIGDNLPDTGGNVIDATLNGQVPPDVGAMLITALTNQGRLVEIQELTERIEKLEGQNGFKD